MNKRVILKKYFQKQKKKFSGATLAVPPNGTEVNMKPKTHKKIDKWQHFQQSCVPVQKVVPVPVPQICTGILHWCTALPTFTPSLPKQNCQTLSPLNLYDTGSFLPAATNLSSYNTATLACRRVWQCCMNRGLSLAGRNKLSVKKEIWP